MMLTQLEDCEPGGNVEEGARLVCVCVFVYVCVCMPLSDIILQHTED